MPLDGSANTWHGYPVVVWVTCRNHTSCAAEVNADNQGVVFINIRVSILVR